MKNLVIAVSPDSSLDLLRSYADVVVLDRDLILNMKSSYDTIYIRSHFSNPLLTPQNFRNEIDKMVLAAKTRNSNTHFIDGMDNVDTIIAFEDKWAQYKTFRDFMPKTKLFNEGINASSFDRPIYKKRLSSRGVGVTWDKNDTSHTSSEWIIQESLMIKEELRVYIICGEVYPIGAIRKSKTSMQHTEVISVRNLSQDEIDFSSQLMSRAASIDIAGIDIARTFDGSLFLMEVNRSPGFAKFTEFTGFNLAQILYSRVNDSKS